MRGLKSIALKTATVLLSLAIFLVALEALVRVFNLAQPRLGQQHPLYGTSYIPGQSAVNEYGVRIDIGEHGFRGQAPEVEKAPGRYRVVLLGNSFLQAVALPFQKVFYTLLNQRFKSRGLPIEIINLGVEGHATVQEYLVYLNEGRRYRPDLVILFCYPAHDLTVNWPPKPNKPAFKLVGDRLEYVPFEVLRRGSFQDFCRRNVRVFSYLPDLLRSRLALVVDKVQGRNPQASREKRLREALDLVDIRWTPALLAKTEANEDWRVTLV
ncbi:MAG: hypothetical protein AB1896_23605, partial [Thermodesulfobacteriota bacterium]